MKDFEYRLIADAVIARPGVSEKVEEIIRSATSEANLSGRNLWYTLAYSGMTLGVEELQNTFLDMTTGQVNHLRDTCEKLQDAIPKISDLDALKDIEKVLTVNRAALAERSRILIGIHVQNAKSTYGITEEELTSDCRPGPLLAQRIGFMAYQRSTAYFVGWFYAKKEDKLSGMDCTCLNCMQRMVPAKIGSEDVLVEQAIKHFGNLSEVFREFGEFLLYDLRDNLAKQMQGASPLHASSVTDMPDLVQRIMTQMRTGNGGVTKG